jgi:hypothetical protein
MFVQTMSYSEMRQEFTKDIEFLNQKIFHIGHDISKLMRKTNCKKIDKVVEYISPRKNRWFIHFTSDNGPNSIEYGFYCLMLTHRNYAVLSAQIDNGQLFYHCSHFFARYCERTRMKSASPKEVIPKFFHSESIYNYDVVKKVEPKINQIFVQYNSGVGLGYHHRDINLFEMRTYLPNEMLTGDKLQRSQLMETKFLLHGIRFGPKIN